MNEPGSSRRCLPCHQSPVHNKPQMLQSAALCARWCICLKEPWNMGKLRWWTVATSTCICFALHLTTICSLVCALEHMPWRALANIGQLRWWIGKPETLCSADSALFLVDKSFYITKHYKSFYRLEGDVFKHSDRTQELCGSTGTRELYAARSWAL